MYKDFLYFCQQLKHKVPGKSFISMCLLLCVIKEKLKKD